MNLEQFLKLNQSNPNLMNRIDASGRKAYRDKDIKGQNIDIGLIGNFSGWHEKVVNSFLINLIVGICHEANVHFYDCGVDIYPDEIAKAIVKGTNDGMHFMSVSYSHYYNDQELEDACDYAWENNCIVFGTVGNTGEKERRYPAAYEHCIGVASLGNNHIVSDFSTYGYAFCCYYGEHMPGCKDDDYSMYSGTSFAQPIACGVAVLMLCEIFLEGKEHPGSKAFVDMYIANCVDVGEIGFDEYTGYGIPTLDKNALLECHANIHDTDGDGITQRINEINDLLKANPVMQTEEAEAIVNPKYELVIHSDGIPYYGGRKL